ncbi:GNAT family N-acetyltransferase [Ottowia testudinis]|uniref:GNAT family N-acetyltransferase n=1 Tax=Ottowia testudinis TaxID=2816950 RepID=A0A975CHV4_9BURK|nr:GNAT family N-acetyltransferase [Ottowia testudinis]QTD46655.1 GNAT family N-acetyltransferase [Ottowia testudinis]
MHQVEHEGSSIQILQARVSDVPAVALVLGAAAAALRQCGQSLWSIDEVSESMIHPHVESGLYHVAYRGHEPMGVLRFQLEDRDFWPEIAPGSSAYVHKLAVLPEHRGGGLAQLLLTHAVELTRQHGRRVLRLDCMGGRPKLRAVYERFGFQHHSQIKLGNRLFDRFELDVAPPAY